MAIPKLTDLVLYVTKALTGADWNTNWQKIITWLTSGSTDIKVNNVEANSMTNNGTITSNGATINGNADISGNLNVGGVISGDGSRLTGIISTSTIAWTPFTVNKGYIDTTSSSPTYGKEIPMYKEDGYNSLIKFNVPITATTSDGENFTLDLLDDFDVSNTGNGTYVVCIKKGQQRAELKEGANGVYRQRLAPTDVSIPNNTLWLDTSTENIQCYEKLNNNWETEYDGVPLGEVVVSGGEVSSLTIYHYNWNGYNINVQEEINISQRPAVVIKSYKSGTNWYRVYSDGFVEQGGRVTFPSGSATQTETVTYHVALASNPLSINLTPVPNDNNYADHWYVKSFGSSSMVVASGVYGSEKTALLWEVKGYK